MVSQSLQQVSGQEFRRTWTQNGPPYAVEVKKKKDFLDLFDSFRPLWRTVLSTN